MYQLAGEVSSVRARIRRARREVEALPDGGRSVVEQEVEIRECRARVERLRGVLAGLREGSGAEGEEGVG